VAIGREVPQIANPHVQRAALDRAAHDPGRQRLLDHRRKDRNDVESHSMQRLLIDEC